MNDKKIFQVINLIDDDLIAEAIGPAKKVQRIRILKTVLIAAVILSFCALSVFAAHIITSRSCSGNSIPDYFSAPLPQTLKKDIGIAPQVTTRFKNGYTFGTGGILQNDDYDQEGNVAETYKSFHCSYLCGPDRITLYIDGSITGNQMDNSETVRTYKNSEIKYYAYTNKIVPGDYQLTEQDQMDKEKGRYVFSYGSEEIEIHAVQIVSWKYKELNYTLCAIDNHITKDELANMAAELIDHQD